MNKPLPATDLVARLRAIAWGHKGRYEPLENKAADEIERLRAQAVNQCVRVRALECALDAALAAKVIFDDNAKKLAAKPTPAEKAPAANSTVFSGPLTAKAAEFSHGLHSRTRGLTGHIEQVLASANGLGCKNPVVRLQAEADAVKVIAAAFKDFGFSTVQVQRVYFSGGDFYAAVTVPSGTDGDYCRAVQELTGYKLRCVPA